MSEATPEFVETEADPEFESEAWGTPESEAEPEAQDEAWPDSDRSRRERQMRMLRARQQAQLRRQPPPRPRRPQPKAPQRMTRFTGPSASQIRDIQTDVISLDLDTNAKLNRLRRALDESRKDQYRNSVLTELQAGAATAVSLWPLPPWAKALVIAAPTVLAKPYPSGARPPGIAGVAEDTRVWGTAGLLAIVGLYYLRKESQGVSKIAIEYKGPLTATAGAKNNTATLTAVALDSAGRQVPDVAYAYQLSNSSIINVTPQQTPGVYQLNGLSTGPTYFTVTVGRKSTGVWVDVT
jgi:hypothetical protein